MAAKNDGAIQIRHFATSHDGRKGTYQQPMGKLGKKSAAVWSATTKGASVGQHREKHRDCSRKCCRAGPTDRPAQRMPETSICWWKKSMTHVATAWSFREAATETRATSWKWQELRTPFAASCTLRSWIYQEVN